MRKYCRVLATALLTCLWVAGANAVTLVYDFTGDCDDCAFNGNPGDPGFGYDPNTNTLSYLNDGLTQTVTGRLTLNGSYYSDGNFYIGPGSTFRYDGSNLINPFVATGLGGNLQGRADLTGLTPPLQTAFTLNAGRVEFGAFANADPNSPDSFPNFCTALGQQFFAPNPSSPIYTIGDACSEVQFVFFSMDNNGNWSIMGTQGFDIGGNGQFTLASVPLPGSAVLLFSGLIGFSRYMRRSTM